LKKKKTRGVGRPEDEPGCNGGEIHTDWGFGNAMGGGGSSDERQEGVKKPRREEKKNHPKGMGGVVVIKGSSNDSVLARKNGLLKALGG